MDNFFIPTSPSIPREFLGDVGFFFSLYLVFSPQEHGNSLQETPLFYRFSTVDAPSILHRWSIVSMEDRWTTDGLSMEYPRSFKGGICLFTP